VNLRRLIAAISVFAIAATGIGVSIAMITAINDPPPAPSASPLPTPTPKVPTPAEFQIGVVVTAEDCNVPAGCVYKYRVEPKYLGLHPLPNTPVKVIYQVTGGHEPQTGDFTVQGGQARVLQDVPIEGPPGAQLKASVTKIEGYGP
jgi:hypothetical protein